MNTDSPLVSVIIPVYNAEQHVCEAIESVLCQTYKNIEVLTIDDGSTDRSADLLKGYGARIRVFHKSNGGVSSARNFGLHEANGELIAFLDADDLWLPNKLQQQVTFLDEHPQYGVCYSKYIFFDDKKPNDDGMIKSRSYPSGWIFDEILTSAPFIGIGTVLANRSCFDKIGAFDETLATAEDTNLFLRLAKEYQFGYMPGPLAKYRIHQGSLTKRVDVVKGTVKSLDNIVEKHPELHPSEYKPMRQAYALRYASIASGYYYRNEHRNARQNAMKAIRYSPFSWRAWRYAFASIAPRSLVTIVKKLRPE